MKAYEKAQKVPLPFSQDRRRKLTAEQKIEILEMKNKVSAHEVSRIFDVNRRLIQFIWYPERLQKHKELSAIRRLDGRYKISNYETKAQWAARQREYKNRKYQLYKLNNNKLHDQTF